MVVRICLLQDSDHTTPEKIIYPPGANGGPKKTRGVFSRMNLVRLGGQIEGGTPIEISRCILVQRETCFCELVRKLGVKSYFGQQ